VIDYFVLFTASLWNLWSTRQACWFSRWRRSHLPHVNCSVRQFGLFWKRGRCCKLVHL